MEKLEHIVYFRAGHDCIRFECKFEKETCKPNTGGSHGVHGVDICFFVKGEKGAVQFILSTGWMPQHAERDDIGCLTVERWNVSSVADRYPCPVDLGYHSPVPMYEGQALMTDSCDLLNGKPCYYDGSGLQAKDPMYILVNGGDEALWEFLDSVYMARFEGGERIPITEYPKPLRSESETLAKRAGQVSVPN